MMFYRFFVLLLLSIISNVSLAITVVTDRRKRVRPQWCWWWSNLVDRVRSGDAMTPLTSNDLAKAKRINEMTANEGERFAKLVEAGKLMNIPILDHVIVGVPSADNSEFFSMAAARVGGFN